MKFSIKSYLLLFAVVSASVCMADAPEGYYKDCAGKSRSALKSQLYSIIKSHKAISYSSGTWDAFRFTDADPTGTYWMDIYTHEQVSISGHDGMNVEHTFPKSWWGGASNNAYRDIVHLMPVDQWANNDRSNHPFGEVDPAKVKAPNYRCQSPNYTLGAPVSGQGGGANYVFEPADEYKGDLARTYFYMVTCYQDLTWAADGLRTAAQGIYPTLQPWAIEMLLRWHRQDPVSDKERKRNDGVYSQQQNRNPFIDHPEMVEHIWGNLMDKGWQDGEVIDPIDPVDPVDPVDPEEAVITAPLNGDITTFEAQEPGSAVTHIVPVLGSGFTHSVIASISGPDADCYDIMVAGLPMKTIAIPAADINKEEGCSMEVRYMPKEATDEAPHVATLTLSGSDLKNDVTLRFEGACAEASVIEIQAEPDADARFFTIDGKPLRGKPESKGIYIMVSKGKTLKYIAR